MAVHGGVVTVSEGEVESKRKLQNFSSYVRHAKVAMMFTTGAGGRNFR
jgi:hypothetical protein